MINYGYTKDDNGALMKKLKNELQATTLSLETI